jgi:hypothetical protein
MAVVREIRKENRRLDADNLRATVIFAQVNPLDLKPPVNLVGGAQAWRIAHVLEQPKVQIYSLTTVQLVLWVRVLAVERDGIRWPAARCPIGID